MGEVWAAEHVALGMKVAVKTLLPHARQVPEIVARFQREAVLLVRGTGDHLPRILDYLPDSAYGPVLVTEFVEGESLTELLKRRRLSVEEAVDLGIDLATGLAELHRAGVVHRDLKPGNVILQPIGDGKTRAIIIDLGVGRLVTVTGEDPPDELAAITTGEMVMGTLEYMPPEQILHCRDVTPAADLYALGAVLFRSVMGRHVFGGPLERTELARIKLTKAAPPLLTRRADPAARGLVTVVGRALQRDPSMRYSSAEKLGADLRDVRDGAFRRVDQPRGQAVDVDISDLAAPADHKATTWGIRAALAGARALGGRSGVFATVALLALVVACVLVGRTNTSSSSALLEPGSPAGAADHAAAVRRDDPAPRQARAAVGAMMPAP
jgi:serine/threonine protein kinase